WTEFVVDLDDHRLSRLVGARSQGRHDVDQANPQAVAYAEAKPPRLGDEQQQRMIDGEQPGGNSRQPVDVENIAPDRARGRGRIADRLDHLDGTRLHAAVKARSYAVEGVGDRRSLVFEYGALQLS